MLDFSKMHTTREESDTIIAIMQRAAKINPNFDRLHLVMDLTVCHNFTPLNLDELLKADGYDFAHDVWGIMRHLDRETGELRDCFLPRFAKTDSQLEAEAAAACREEERAERALSSDYGR